MNKSAQTTEATKGNATANTVKQYDSIAARLYRHLFEEDGTINDGDTGALYDEAHGTESEEVELETVEAWAIDTASRYATKHELPLNNA